MVYLSIFSYSSLNFFRTAILNCQVNHISLFLWDRLLENFCVLWVISCVLDSLCSLNSCISLLAFVVASCIFTNWFQERNTLSALLWIWGFLRTSIAISAPHFLPPLVVEFLNWNEFSQPYRAMPGADNLSFAFPRVVLNVQVCQSPGPTDSSSLSSVQFSHSVVSPSAKACSCHSLGTHTGSQAWGNGACGWALQSTGECAGAQRGGLQVRHPHWLMGRHPPWSP